MLDETFEHRYISPLFQVAQAGGNSNIQAIKSPSSRVKQYCCRSHLLVHVDEGVYIPN